MTNQQKKILCNGCRNNRYNQGTGYVERPGIDSVVTCDECIYLESASVVKRKEVSVLQRPPFNQKASRTLSCYSRSGYVYIESERLC